MKTNELTLNWTPYCPYAHSIVIRYAPSSPGVYKLARPTGRGKFRVFYVGQAINLRERLKDHLSNYEPNQCLKSQLAIGDTFFAFAVIFDKRIRSNVERTLYDYFQPTSNLNQPYAPTISVNTTNNN